jgi:hypothetical protein
MSAAMSIVQNHIEPSVETESSTKPGVTHFSFTGKVFQIPGVRFTSVGTKREARFYVQLGNMEASMDIQTLCAEFAIQPDSADDRLIAMAVKGLKYVPDIRPGDVIPSEILTGTASWPIQLRHRQIAERRLQVQLLSWVSGKEMLLTDNDELAMFLEQIENKTKLKEAFEAAAEALGRERKDYEAVLGQIDLLARELCYIEALRDRFAKISDIREKLKKLRGLYSSDARLRDEIQRISMLLERAVAKYERRFQEVDAQTSEIIGALKALDRQIAYIRLARDELHFILRDWEPALKKWDETPLKRCRAQDLLLSDTYRLLATWFAPSRSVLKQ